MPSDFDWVTARGQCSALNVFELLKSDAQRNVAAMEAIAKARGTSSGLQFHTNDGSFVITRRQFTEVGVKFILSVDQIEIESVGVDVRFTAGLTLNDDGECRLLVNNEQLDRWQVLRRSLEPLFFPQDR